MDFIGLPPRRPPRRIAPHAAILGVFALSLAIFGTARDEYSGPGQLIDVLPYSTVFLAAGYFLGWLPAIWRRTDATPFEPIVLPAFFGLVIAYLYFVFRVFLVQPAATTTTVVLQVIALVWLSCRLP